MFELVSLADYRRALQVVRERALARQWQDVRFADLEYFDFFRVPAVCGTSDSIYMKVGDGEAIVWSYKLEEGPYGPDACFRFPPRLPALPLEVGWL